MTWRTRILLMDSSTKWVNCQCIILVSLLVSEETTFFLFRHTEYDCSIKKDHFPSLMIGLLLSTVM